jgi:hypothetical protein
MRRDGRIIVLAVPKDSEKLQVLNNECCLE